MAWLMFVILAAMLIGSAWRVVNSDDLVHAVLWLAVTLVTTAVVYITLNADFLAAAQVLLYTGGVITLMLFGIMLTQRSSEGGAFIRHGSHRRPAALAAGLLFLGLVYLGVFSGGPLPAFPERVDFSTQALGALFLGPLMLPFEVVSILLLAAMIGAITLARRTDP